MKTRIASATLLVLAFFVLQAPAQPDVRILAPFLNAEEAQPGGKDKAKDPDKDKKPPEKKPVESPLIDFTAPFRRSEFASGYNPQMLGDLGVLFAVINSTVFGTKTTTITVTPGFGNAAVGFTNTKTEPATQTRQFLVPYAAYGSFKVAENASPMPVDRVFFTYNYFNSIRAARNGPTGPTTTTTQATAILGLGAVLSQTTTTVYPGAPYVDLHREVLGFEKTFLDGRASVEVRLPILQQLGSLDDFRSCHMGDVTVLGKYAFLLDRTTGDVLSGGLAVTAPTGPSIDTIDGKIHSTLLQPWGGYVWNQNNFFLQGFHSIVVPTDARDITLLFNDVGIGYWLYRGDGNRPIQFIVPTVEIHVTTPLNHRNGNGPIVAPDLVAPTAGVHFGLFRSSTLSFAVSAPITGPRIYGVEAFVQFNWRF